MLQIDVKTDSARLLQTEANGKILGKLSESCCASRRFQDEQEMQTAHGDAKLGQ